MPITYGRALTRFWGAEQLSGTVLMKAYTTHTQKSEVFLSYQRADHGTALNLARYLDEVGRSVFIDIHDDALKLGDSALDSALMTAILNSNTMVIVVSDQTQNSWWVPWEIGVSTPSGKPRAMYKPSVSKPLPEYLEKLPRLPDYGSTNLWVLENKRLG